MITPRVARGEARHAGDGKPGFPDWPATIDAHVALCHRFLLITLPPPRARRVRGIAEGCINAALQFFQLRSGSLDLRVTSLVPILKQVDQYLEVVALLVKLLKTTIE